MVEGIDYVGRNVCTQLYLTASRRNSLARFVTHEMDDQQSD